MRVRAHTHTHTHLRRCICGNNDRSNISFYPLGAMNGSLAINSINNIVFFS